MNFSQSFLDEIRARLPVSEVVARSVKLTKRGREFVGLSPFNPEKTPSFTVNDQKGFYHCFSSGKHGDIFRFVMEVEGLGFPEAVERLAGEAGVPMPVPSEHDVARERVRTELTDVMEHAARFFEDRLQHASGAAARGYLSDRGLEVRTQQAFRLGYAPGDRSALKTHLAGLGISQVQMIEAGLLIAGDDIPVSYDRFRDRVIFPITSSAGKVIAFGGRALSPDVPAKYLNSPETPLFHKGSVLYNYANARKPAYDAGTIVVAEGYMDVIALSAAGFTHAVAPLGTALTPDQLRLLWRVVPEPILCFDGDRAGLKAAYRAADTVLPLLKPGYSVRFALLPDGEDPDDLIRRGGRDAMEEVLGAAKPLADMIWAREVETGQWDTPERRALLEARFDELTGQIEDEKIRRHYTSHLRDRLRRHWGRDTGGWQGGGRGATRRTQVPRGAQGRKPGYGSRFQAAAPASESLKSSGLVRSTLPKDSQRERILLLGVINHPVLLDLYAEEFAEVEFGSGELDRLRAEILDIAAHCVPLDRNTLQRQLEDNDLLGLVDRLTRACAQGNDWFIEADVADKDAETGWLHTLALHRKSLTLQKELKAAELAFGQESSDENFERLKDILDQVAGSEGTEAIVEGFGESRRDHG